MNHVYKALIVLIVYLIGLTIANEVLDVVLNTLHLSILSIFMFGASMLVHHLTIKASKENPKRFPAYFMAITGLKMMVYVLSLAVYVFIFQTEAIPVVIGFLMLYLIFTTLEVLSAVKEVRNNPH